MSNLPVLVASTDLLPSGGPLNGRRSAGQTLLWLWAKYSASDPLNLAVASNELRPAFENYARLAGHQGLLNTLDFINPEEISPHDALFLPDPSIGRWAHWRALIGSGNFSLVGQIHTLSTPASMNLLQELVTEPTRRWDAVICSSHAGKAVVEAVIEDRENQILNRFGPKSINFKSSTRPYLPVIPLPIPTDHIREKLIPKVLARKQLGINQNGHVILWLGRLSMLTKSDPWPTYTILEQSAKLLNQPLTLIECGPDDTSHQANHFKELRNLCPNVQFVRFGGKEPVSETIKSACLASADIAISLVDNTQETFGLAVAEAMAAGLPVVASDWNGYRDLIRHGVDGFLIPTKWSSVSEDLSIRLGWASSLGVIKFPMAAGCLAQLVQFDYQAAIAAIVSLLSQPVMNRAMGDVAQKQASNTFSDEIVMGKYLELFQFLKERRLNAPKSCFFPEKSSITINPVTAFQSYPSEENSTCFGDLNHKNKDVPKKVIEARDPLWNQLRKFVSPSYADKLEEELLLKHQTFN